MTRVLLADDIVRAAGVLDSLASGDSQAEVCGVARTPATLVDELRALLPDVVLLRERFAGVDARAMAEEVSLLSPGTRVILLSDGAESDDGARSLPRGAEQQLSAAPTSGELTDAILGDERAAVPADVAPSWGVVDRDAATTPAWAFGGGAPPQDQADLPPPDTAIASEDSGAAPDSPPPAGAELAMQEIVPRRVVHRSGTKPSEVFVVFAGKGGVGKSVVATNLAAALAHDNGARVAIIDLDLQFGDVGVMLGVDHPHTIEELAPLGEQMDGEFLEQILGDGPEGVRVLLAPTSPELADLVTVGTLRAIIRELGKSYDYVIVDAAAHLEERTLEVIEMADHIVIVTAFNVTAVKDTKITLKLLQSLGIEREKIAVVLNQTRAKTNFTREEVEDSLRFRIVTQLPFEPRVVDEAVDHGKPFVLSEPRAEITRQFRALVDYLVPVEETDSGTEGDPKKGRSKAKAKPNRRRFSLGRSS